MDYERHIFANFFKVSNALQVYLDQQLKEDHLTAKQMFLMIVIGSFGSDYPTYAEVAERFGTSYQNVKLLAIKLETNGYLDIQDDPLDKRAKRLVLTPHAKAYWENRDSNDSMEMKALFCGFEETELKQFLTLIMKLDAGLGNLKGGLISNKVHEDPGQ